MNKISKIIMYSLLSLVLLVGIIFCFYYYNKSNKVVSTVTMDINPSIKLNLNYKNIVIRAEGLNEDGKELLQVKDFKGNTLNVAIEDIIKIVIEKGYTTDDNSILVNVEGKNIKNEVVALLENEFRNNNKECNIIIQEINEEAKENATKYGISESKASYIDNIIKEVEDINFEDLKDKTINEINQTIKEKEEQEEQQKEQQEEIQKQEEQKVPINSGSDSVQDRICNAAVHNYTKDAALEAVRKYIGADSTINAQQIIEHYYGEICAYETYMIYNKQLYKMYHSVTDLSLVHVETTPFFTETYMDIIKICKDYFINKYGALAEEVNVTGSSNGLFLDGSYKTPIADVTYKDNNYNIKIDALTGNVISEIKTN